MQTVRYFVTSAGNPNFFNFDLNYGTLNLVGQEVLFYGTRYIDSVFVRAGWVSVTWHVAG